MNIHFKYRDYGVDFDTVTRIVRVKGTAGTSVMPLQNASQDLQRAAIAAKVERQQIQSRVQHHYSLL